MNIISQKNKASVINLFMIIRMITFLSIIYENYFEK